MSSIREHLERIRDRHVHQHLADAGEWCLYCNRPHPCLDFEDAVAALAQLDAAEHEDRFISPWLTRVAVIRDFKPDPLEHTTHVDPCECAACNPLVPDPLVPRLDANPNTKEDA